MLCKETSDTGKCQLPIAIGKVKINEIEGLHKTCLSCSLEQDDTEFHSSQLLDILL